MQRKVLALYVVVLIATINMVSAYQFSRVRDEIFSLNITYNWHRCNCNYYNFYHEYDTITIQRYIHISSYGSTLGSYDVFDYPLWLDISSWAEGQTVVIGDYTYELTPDKGTWTAHREYGESYTNLYYESTLGFLSGVYIDTITLDPYGGFSGYSINIDLGANNIGELAYYVTGSYLIFDNLLILGIFIELACIHWLIIRRKKAS